MFFKFFISGFMMIHHVLELIIGLYWVACLCRHLYAPVQKSIRNNPEQIHRPTQMAPLTDEYTTGLQIRPTLLLDDYSPLLAPLMTEESTPKAVFQPPKLTESTCHDLKEILWVPNFYYICQICCLRLGVRSSGFTHD